jgi:hypothetical protein
LEQYFVQLRREGVSAEVAAEKTLHVYGGGRRPSDLRYRIDRAEAMFAREQAELSVEPATEVELPADPMDEASREIRDRITALEADRQRLSLDALADDRARQRLTQVEADLAEACAGGERVALARIEAQRRAQEEQKQAERQVVEAGVHRARALQAGREAAAAKVDETALAFAQALAEHQGVSAGQAEALTEAGRPDAWRSVIAPAWVLQAALAHALLAAGAAAPAELDQMAISRHAPLAALDVHAVEPIPSNPKEK